MKRLYDGDKLGAINLLEQCLATHQDNYVEYTSATVELRELKKQ